MGLTYDYFYSLTPRIFHNITVGYYRKKDQQYKDQWEQTRQIVVSVLTPHLKKGVSRNSIMKFPWDDATEQTATIEDISSINANEVLQAQQDFWARVDEMKKQN